MLPPPAAVLRAFGALEVPVLLAGGQGTTWRAGDVVLKPAGDETESAWTAVLFATLDGPGFRVPRPRSARDGNWVAGGWVAWEHIDGEPAGPNGGRWEETIAACEAFHAALRGVPRPAFIEAKTDAWAVADRMAWGEVPLDVLAPYAPLVSRLAALLRPVESRSQLVHGDFTANVLFAEGKPPAVIDFSPYWRPAGFAVGVIVADALSWGGADESVIRLAAHLPEFAQMLVRAELRRVLELDQHHRRGQAARSLAQIPAHEGTVAIVEEFAAKSG